MMEVALSLANRRKWPIETSLSLHVLSPSPFLFNLGGTNLITINLGMLETKKRKTKHYHFTPESL